MKAHPLDLLLALGNIDRAIDAVCREFIKAGLTAGQFSALSRLLEANQVGLSAIIVLNFDMDGLPDNNWYRDRYHSLLAHMDEVVR